MKQSGDFFRDHLSGWFGREMQEIINQCYRLKTFKLLIFIERRDCIPRVLILMEFFIQCINFGIQMY